MNCFKNLGSLPVQSFDEARHGISAYEMLKNKEYIINTYNYQNDYWNLKPPLSFWSIILGFKIFGFNVFAMRFYSAASLFITISIVSIFTMKKFGKLESLITAIILSVCGPLYVFHVGRNGDADALYLLCFTISIIAMFYINKNKKTLYICGLFFSFAFLTKSWHSFSIAAIGGLYILLSGEIKKIRFKEWIIFILSFTVPIACWVITRILKDGKKFLTTMVQYDLIERSKRPLEGHIGDKWFYFDYLTNNPKMIALFAICIITITIMLYGKKLQNYKNELLGLMLWIIVPFVIFTRSQTKIVWYIIPIYIPLIMLTGIGLGKILKNREISNYVKIFIILIFVICIGREGKSLYRTILFQQREPVQEFLVNDISSIKEINEDEAYIQVENVETENGQWSQSYLFLGEITEDFKCKDGGVSEYLKTKNKAILITNQQGYKEYEEKLKDFKILKTNGDLYLISK